MRRVVELAAAAAPRACVTAALLLTCIGGDALGRSPWVVERPARRAAVDSATHGAVALLAWTVAAASGDGWRNAGRLAAQAVSCCLLAVLIDLDHFWMAGSLSLKSALSLPTRPPLHATTAIPAVVLLLHLCIRLTNAASLHSLPLLVAVAWTTHHVRDATRRGFWLWPLGSTPPLPYWLYVATEICIPYGILVVRTTLRCEVESANRASIV
ncbi:PREDICTED: transmembrane protein C5orf28 homolog [Priapulus caudatus]|uniref:Transmembrane protein 267 n=1 Tax=Priapulus caudatus TaxID=37621 RepID=A0ABM1E401_PRICU|nr:PREDICTED: transmembrane protein C5orf28 homolog [Priapulus caudatus]